VPEHQRFEGRIRLVRGVVEATAKECGIDKGTLHPKIESLPTQGDIRGLTKDAAHELRYRGNDVAHGDFVNEVDEDDADAVLDVMTEILSEVCQGPARVNRMKVKRQGQGETDTTLHIARPLQVDDISKILLGAVAAGFFTLFGTWINSRRERTKWLRQEKVKAYTDFLIVIKGVVWTVHTAGIEGLPRPDVVSLTSASRQIEQARILVLAPPDVYFPAEKTVNAVAEMAGVVAGGPDIQAVEAFNKAAGAVKTARAELSAAM
jgi:hypothetical protein